MTAPTAESIEAQGKILRYLRDSSVPGTYRGIAKDLGLSFGVVRGHLSTLRRRGLVTWEPGLARTIRLTHAGREEAR
jgi:predicted ArsR family transcriptional regulator